MGKLKTFSINKIADTILKELSKEDETNKKSSFLDILDKKQIYYTQKIIDSVIDLLKKKGFIEKMPNCFLASSFSKTKELDIAKIPSEIDVFISKYKITRDGSHFVNSGQKIDSSKVNYVEKFKSWWQSKCWIVVIVVIIMILLFILRFYPYFVKFQNYL